jgi:hypothetical protein
MARMNYIYRQRNCGQTLSVPPSKPQQLNHQRWKKHSRRFKGKKSLPAFLFVEKTVGSTFPYYKKR